MTTRRRSAGAGNVRQRGYTVMVDGKAHKPWTYQFAAVDPETGQRRLVSRSKDELGRPLLTAAAARQAMAVHRQRLRDGARPLRDPTGSVGDYLTSWLGQVDAAVTSGRRRPTTAAHHRTMVDNYLVPTLGHHGLARLGPADIAAAMMRLRSSGGHKGRPLSATTVRHAFVTLNKALGAAVTAGTLAASPIARMTDDQKPERPGRRSTGKAAAWSGEQAAAFAAVAVAVADDDPAALALAVALRTGVRRGELVGMRWGDITEEERDDGRTGGHLTVSRSVVMIAGQRHESEPKTAAGHRTVPVSPEVMDLFALARRRQAGQRLAAGEAWEGPAAGAADAPVFRKRDGAPLHPQALRHTLARLARAARVPALSVHGLRHTFATIALVEHRIPVPVVSRWLGHASPSITLDVYAHVLRGADQDYADALGATFAVQ